MGAIRDLQESSTVDVRVGPRHWRLRHVAPEAFIAYRSVRVAVIAPEDLVGEAANAPKKPAMPTDEEWAAMGPEESEAALVQIREWAVESLRREKKADEKLPPNSRKLLSDSSIALACASVCALQARDGAWEPCTLFVGKEWPEDAETTGRTPTAAIPPGELMEIAQFAWEFQLGGEAAVKLLRLFLDGRGDTVAPTPAGGGVLAEAVGLPAGP